MKKVFIIGAIILLGVAGWVTNFYYKNLRGAAPAFVPSPAINMTELPLKLPDGFSISIFANNILNARVLTWDSMGKLLVSSPATGKILRVSQTGEVSEVVANLNKPHGLAFKDGKLFIAETDAVSVYDYDGKATNRKKIIDLPGGGNHFSRTIGFGPDGKLYISVGSSCNVCGEKNNWRASISQANPDGSDHRSYAYGLRNSVFFIWHPKTKKMWATEMGRDLLGDDIPPDEINIVENYGMYGPRSYGWPYCYGKQVLDATFDSSDLAKSQCGEASHIDLPAHSAPLGLAFIPESWGSEYAGDLLVAFHGSWNRTEPTGYKIVRFDLDENGKSKGQTDFLSGFLEGNIALGRPVDLLFDTEGNLFISDDKAGVVYRMTKQ